MGRPTVTVAAWRLLWCLLLWSRLAALISAEPLSFDQLPGEMRVRVVYSLTEGLQARGGVRVTLPMRTATDVPSVVVSLENVVARTNQDLDGDFAEDIFTPSAPVRLAVRSARMELYGPFWEGGPDVRVRIGQFYTSYSDWVARNVGLRGIELYGVPLPGGYDLRMHYAYPNAWLALRVDGGQGNRVARLSALHRPIGEGREYVTDLHGFLRLGSIRSTHTLLDVARDGGSGALAFEWRSVHHLGRLGRVTARSWASQADFDPPRTRRNQVGETVLFTAGERGTEVELSRTHGPFIATARIRQARGSEQADRSSWAFSVSHARDVKHYAEVERRVDEAGPVSQLQVRREDPRSDSAVAAVVKWETYGVTWSLYAAKGYQIGLQPVRFGAMLQRERGVLLGKIEMTWEAPNGVRFGIHYATHPYEAFGLEPIERHPAGLYLTGSVSLEF